MNPRHLISLALFWALTGCVYVDLGGGPVSDAGCPGCPTRETEGGAGARDDLGDVTSESADAGDDGPAEEPTPQDASELDASENDGSTEPEMDAAVEADDAGPDAFADAFADADAETSDAGMFEDSGSDDEGDGGLSGQIEVPGDWGDGALYPAIGGAYADQAPMEGTCTFDGATGQMTLRVDDVAQTVTIGARAEDAAIVINGATCGSPPATSITLRAMSLTVNQERSAEQVVVLDAIAGFFALGTSTGGGIFADLGGGFDRIRIRGTPVSDSVTFGGAGVALNGDAFRDLRPRNVEAFDVSLGQGADVFSAAGGTAGTGDGFLGDIAVLGGPGADALMGGPRDDTLSGGPGNDTLRGGLGDDTLFGGDGDDFFREGADLSGADIFLGGAGNDTVDYALRTHDLSVTMDGRAADDGERDESDNVGADVEGLLAGSGDDLVTGNALANILVGGPGFDTLRGGNGNDTLDGGEDDDTLDGGPGDDMLDGGAGDDALDGGTGSNDLQCGPGDDTATQTGTGRVDCEGAEDAVYRLTGLVAWFKADAITGLSSGASIASWPNSANVAASASQSDSAMRPTFVANARNGLPIVRIVEPARLDTTIVPATGAAPRTVFLVCKAYFTQWNLERPVFAWGDGDRYDPRLYALTLNYWWSPYAVDFGSDIHGSNSAHIDDFQLVAAEYDGTTHRMWIDGAAAGNPTKNIALQTNATPLRIGGTLISPDYAEVGEILIYADDLASRDREAIECALQHKWSTPALGHACP